MKPALFNNNNQSRENSQKPFGCKNKNIQELFSSSLQASSVSFEKKIFLAHSRTYCCQKRSSFSNKFKENSQPSSCASLNPSSPPAQTSATKVSQMRSLQQTQINPEIRHSPRNYSMDANAELMVESVPLSAFQPVNQGEFQMNSMPFKKRGRGRAPYDEDIVMQDRSNTVGEVYVSSLVQSQNLPFNLPPPHAMTTGDTLQPAFKQQPGKGNSSHPMSARMSNQPPQIFDTVHLEQSMICNQAAPVSSGSNSQRKPLNGDDLCKEIKLQEQLLMNQLQKLHLLQQQKQLEMKSQLPHTSAQLSESDSKAIVHEISDTTLDSTIGSSSHCRPQLLSPGGIGSTKTAKEDSLHTSLMNSSAIEESKSSLFSGVLSPPHTSTSSLYNERTLCNNQSLAARIHEYKQQKPIQSTFGAKQPLIFKQSTESSNVKNLLWQERNYLNYVNQLQPTSLTPNPKLFEQNRKTNNKAANQIRKEGENFAGLQTFIISEIDSDSEKKTGKKHEKFLSDVSSFSNSSHSSVDDYDEPIKRQNSSSQSEEDFEEGQDLVLGGIMKAKTPRNVIDQIWQQTPMIKESADTRGFITESPFSFKKPIFFSVPRDNAAKKIKLKQAQRQLFGVNQQPLEPPKPSKKIRQATLPIFNPPAATNDDSGNDFARFVQQQQEKAGQNTSKLSTLMHGLRDGNSSNCVGEHLFRKHQGLFQKPLQTTMASKDGMNKTALFTSERIQESSPIIEENSSSDNFSNLGQGPSPMKQPAALKQQLDPTTINFAATQFKSMTPMPKLMHAFTLPLPRKDSNNSNSGSQQSHQQLNPKQSQLQAEMLSRERVSSLKQDLVETPNSKYKYKQISREMKESEKNGFQAVIKETFSRVLNIPKKVHWRVVLDLADYAKRESRFKEAKVLFKLVSYLQPYAYQGWLEYAKMEEECGNQQKSRKILIQGLKFSSLNDNLFIKAIKVEEKLGNIEAVRALLAELADVPIEKSWKMLLEGALFEGRIGNKEGARKQFRNLMDKCQTYGPLFFEASRYEEREGHLDQSLAICEEGIEQNSKYGPLWFQYLRLFEKMDEHSRQIKFDSLQTVLNEMFTNVPKELDWKIYIEAAQTYDRMGLCDQAICFLSNSVQNCPDNIKWKVWLIAARIQFRLGEYERAREIIERCCYEVPSKQMSMAMLEYAKHFEMRSQGQRARQIMQYTKRIAKAEWKTHFEAVLLEIRSGCFEMAENLVHQSLTVHFATGRLWATLIQLQHARARTEEDFERAFRTFNQALREIPKSGEVWCEGARISMANFGQNNNFKYENAENYLNFAIQFTPQYGDSFLEMLKLYLLTGQTQKIAALRQQCIHAEPNYGVLWFFYKNSSLDNAIEVWERAEKIIKKEIEAYKTEPHTERWIASTALIHHLRNGLVNCPIETKVKIIYGFEYTADILICQAIQCVLVSRSSKMRLRVNN